MGAKYVNAGRYGMAALIVLIVVIPMMGAAFGFDMPDSLGWYISMSFVVWKISGVKDAGSFGFRKRIEFNRMGKTLVGKI